MRSIEVDTVLNNLGNNRVQDYARQEQGLWQKLAKAGVSGSTMDAYGSAIRELQGLNETARLDRSAAGTSLSPGETLDLKAQLSRVNDLGTKAMREYLGGGDQVCRAPNNGETTTPKAAPAPAEAAGAPAGKAEATVKDNKAAATAGPTGTYRDTTTTLDQVGKGQGVLKEGDKGAGVTEAQGLLRQITGQGGKPKYDLGTSGAKQDGVDGFLGPKTKGAIEQFKKDQGLKSDGTGTLDQATLERMRAVAGASALDGAYAPGGTAASTTKPNTTPTASGTNAITNAPSTTTAGPIRFQNGELTVQGTAANEDIVMRRSGDKYRVEYARREGREVVERHALDVPADQLKSARVLGGGGTDRIWNGDGKAAGVDGAELITQGANSSIVNHGKGAKIGLEAQGFVDNFGDGATIVGTRDRTAGRSDWVANAGRGAEILAAPGARIDNTGDGARIKASGYNQINSVANGVAIHSRNHAPDRGNVVGDGNVLYFDEGDANGSVALSNLEALGQGILPGAARQKLTPNNPTVPTDISKK